jgi:type I restriction enzyme, S subunit
MGKYQGYDKYKDSGVEWLGDIPEHWKSLKIKRLTVIKRGASPRPIDDPKYFDDDGEYAWVRIADVTASERYLQTTTQKLSELGKSFSVPLEPGQLFLSIAGSVGKPIITKIKCCIHDGFVYFPDLKVNQEFIYYIFYSGQPYLGLGKMGTQLNLNTETVGGINIGFPPLDEQEKIARFLDYKTKQIDDLIAKKETLIEKLDEKRTSLISHAVTKGIDVNVPMKDSGIEWLGEIPQHWEVVGLTKYLKSLVDYRGKTPEKTEDGVFLVTAKNIKGGIIDYSLSQEFVKEEEYDEIMRRGKPEIGDVLFTTEAPLGEVANVDNTEIALAQRIIKMQGKLNVLDNYFLKYWMIGNSFYQHLQSLCTGSTALGIKASKLCLLKVVLPPLEEQQKITQFIDQKTAEIEEQKTKIQQAIDLLKEYRTALITNAVTGKINVSQVDIP